MPELPDKPHGRPTERRMGRRLGLAGLLCLVAASSPAAPYTDRGGANPPWAAVRGKLRQGEPDNGPVKGSVIDVDNRAVEVGLYGNRRIDAGKLRIHVPCHTASASLGNFPRWFQTDGNTQVFRLLVDDENTANSRTGSVRAEAFMDGGWTHADNRTHEWTGRFTVARRQQSFAIFQLFNLESEWCLQLNLTSAGNLLVNNRRNAKDALVRNPDGTARNVDGAGFDVRVIDDGRHYRCWIDGVLMADNHRDRPAGLNRFRWGMYLGNSVLKPPSDVSLILVSGAQVRSWPGRIADTPEGK